MANKYPGYCVDCGRNVNSGHGELKKSGGKYVVSCGSKRAVPTPKVEKLKLARPTGMRLTDCRIGSSNAALLVRFGINGVGKAESLAPYIEARMNRFRRRGPWTPSLAESAKWMGEDEAVAKARWEESAVRHEIACEANEALYAQLQETGQIACENEYEVRFYLSEEEQLACKQLVEDAQAELLSAIMDGTAAISVQTVGCDFPHPQVCDITLPGAEKPVEYALIQTLLGSFHLHVDGKNECQDLRRAIMAAQGKQQEQNEKKEEHRRKRAAGHHVVAIKQCWECGRTRLLGEMDDDYRIVDMPKSVYDECVAEQRRGHDRSLATVPAGTILSSVGFDPDPVSRFTFVRVEKDWYCGC